jgi:hypothetical protein
MKTGRGLSGSRGRSEKLFVVLTKSTVNTHAGFARTLLPREKQTYRRTSNSNNEACVSCSEDLQGNYRRGAKRLSSLAQSWERGRPRPQWACAKNSHQKDFERLWRGAGEGARAPSNWVTRSCDADFSRKLSPSQKKRTGRQVTGARKTKTDLRQSQNLNLRANCICLDEPESPVGNRVLVITPNVVLPTCAVRPG